MISIAQPRLVKILSHPVVFFKQKKSHGATKICHSEDQDVGRVAANRRTCRGIPRFLRPHSTHTGELWKGDHSAKYGLIFFFRKYALWYCDCVGWFQSNQCSLWCLEGGKWWCANRGNLRKSPSEIRNLRSRSRFIHRCFLEHYVTLKRWSEFMTFV